MTGPFTTHDAMLALVAAFVIIVVLAAVAGGLRSTVYGLTRLIRFVAPALGNTLWADFKEYVTGKDDLRQCVWTLVFLFCLACRVRDIQRSDKRAATRTSESTPAAPDVEAPEDRSVSTYTRTVQQSAILGLEAAASIHAAATLQLGDFIVGSAVIEPPTAAGGLVLGNLRIGS